MLFIGMVVGIVLTILEVQFIQTRLDRWQGQSLPLGVTYSGTDQILPSVAGVEFYCPVDGCAHVSNKDGLCPEHFQFLKPRRQVSRSTT